MTEFEELFLRTMDFYEKRGTPVFLHGSTLLRIIRDGTVQPREDVIHDKEINIGIRAEDFTDVLYKDLAKHPYFNPINDKLPNGLIFYGETEKLTQDESHWEITPGFTLLARYWEGKTKRIEYMGQTHCIVFPKELFETYSKVSILGREFNAPSNIEAYFKTYFGEDWKEENKGWHWSQTKRYVEWEKLEGGEL